RPVMLPTIRQPRARVTSGHVVKLDLKGMADTHPRSVTHTPNVCTPSSDRVGSDVLEVLNDVVDRHEVGLQVDNDQAFIVGGAAIRLALALGVVRARVLEVLKDVVKNREVELQVDDDQAEIAPGAAVRRALAVGLAGPAPDGPHLQLGVVRADM